MKVDLEAARKQVADKSETFYTSNLTPPNGRQIVIAVDQMHIRPGSIRPIMAAASRFLDKLSPLDQVAFIVFPEPGPRVNFTSDKLQLRLAMQGLIGQHPRAIVGTRNIGVTEALAITNRRDQLVLRQVAMRECRSTDPMQRAQCERDIVTEASEITRRLREETEESVAGLSTDPPPADHGGRPQVAHPAVRRARARRSERAAPAGRRWPAPRARRST